MFDKIAGLMGLALMGTFVIGLAESISSGFAGFWGGFPFWVICLIVLPLVAYDYWDTALRRKK